MKKNVTIAVLAIATISLAVLHIGKTPKAEKEIQPVQDNNISKTKTAPAINDAKLKSLEIKLADKTAEIEKLKRQLVLASESNQQKMESVSAETNTANTSDTETVANQALLDKIISSLALQQQGAKIAPPTLKDKYTPLISSLGLSEDKSNKLLALLKNNDSFLEDNNQQIQDEIHDLLGDDDYAKYQEYEETLPTRLFVDDLAVRLADEGHELTEQQVESMLQMDPETVKGIPLSYSPMSITLNNSPDGDITDMVDSAIDTSVDRFDETVESAGNILDPDQMEIFDQYLGERFEQKETAAKAASTLLPEILNKEFIQTINNNGSDNASITFMSVDIVTE